MDDHWDSPFQTVRDSITLNKDSFDDDENTSLEELEAMQVRRGLSKQLSIGPLPIVSSDPKSKADAGVDDDRAQIICNERAITKKFNAILDDLCLSNADNWEGWYRASQCCVMKADSIADRLGLTLGFSRIQNFSVPAKRGSPSRALTILDLQNEQECEERMLNQISFLGDDYSVYMNSAWSSFSSLRDCVAILKKRLNAINGVSHSMQNHTTLAIWEDIDSKYDRGNVLEWQEACGGIFVRALRNLSIRFMCVALYILQSKTEISSDHKVLLSDVCETLGNNFYSELMASQNYGWPMRVMTAKRKRELSATAKSCFQASIKHADDSVEADDDIDDHSTWDLLFMVGKVSEVTWYFL
jgi:bacterioferritin (cytochrome b1)